MSKPMPPLPDAARRELWDRIWDRLLRPIPTEAAPDHVDRADPPDVTDARRDKAVPR